MAVSGSVIVHGGSDPIAADLEQLTALAAALDTAAGAIAGALHLTVRCLADPALITAGVLDPAGAAELLALAGVALAGTGAALASSESVALALRAAAASYRQADELDRRLRPVLVAGWRVPAALAALTGYPALPGRPAAGSPAALQAALTADPGLVDMAVQLVTIAGTAGLPLGTAGLPLGDATARLAGVLASPFADGTPVVTAQPTMPTDDGNGPPRGTGDLVRSLAVRDLHDDGGGAVDVRVLRGPDGRRVIVDITGTTAWNFDPLRPTPQASDLATNLRALANRSSVFERGVLQALHRAGIRRGEPIMLVGHSQGGMIAARLATDLRAGNEFTVTHLVTAGAPIGLAPVPSSVSVLALQNRGDLVPELDGVDNPRRPNWITVQTDAGPGSVLVKHSLRSYLTGARDLDRSADPVLLDWRRTARPFLSAGEISTQVFQIRRAQ